MDSSEISKETSHEIARQAFLNERWLWAEPIKTTRKKHSWVINTNAHARGCNGFIEIDATTGAIIRKRYAPL